MRVYYVYGSNVMGELNMRWGLLRLALDYYASLDAWNAPSTPESQLTERRETKTRKRKREAAVGADIQNVKNVPGAPQGQLFSFPVLDQKEL